MAISFFATGIAVLCRYQSLGDGNARILILRIVCSDCLEFVVLVPVRIPLHRQARDVDREEDDHQQSSEHIQPLHGKPPLFVRHQGALFAFISLGIASIVRAASTRIEGIAVFSVAFTHG